MGRNYRTTNAEQVDFMYKLPEKYMLQAIQTADAGNDAIYAQTDLLGNAVLNINHLTTDQERVNQKQEEYNNRIAEVTNPLAENHADYRKHMPAVRTLSRDLETDMKVGEISAIQSNATKMSEWDKAEKAKLAAGKITVDAYNKAKSAFLGQFEKQGGTNYDSNTKTGNTIYTENLYETQDFAKLLKDKIGSIKSSSRASENTSDGGKWLVTNGGKEEWVSAAKVAQIASDALMSDQNVLGYLKQGAKLGYLNGVVDSDGQFIQPYQLDKEGNPVFNPNSILAAPIRSLVGQEAFRKSETKQDIKANPFKEIELNFSNSMKKLAAETEINKEKFLFEEGVKQANKKELVELKAANDARDEAKAAAIKTKLIDKTSNAAVDLTVTRFGGDLAKSNSQLLNDMEVNRVAATTNRTLANKEGISAEDKGMYMSKALAAERAYTRSAELAHIAREDVNNELRNKHGFSNIELRMLQGIDKTIAQTKAEISDINREGNAYGSIGPGTAVPTQHTTPEMNKLVKRLNYLTKLKRTNDAAMSDWFKTNNETTKHNVTGIGVSSEQQESILTAISTNPELFTKEAIDLTGKGRGDAGFLGNLTQNFPKFSNSIEGMADNFEIMTVNAPTAGMPASITIKTKADNTGIKKEAKTYIVPISGSLQKTLGTQLAKSKDPKAKEVGSLISDFSVATTIAEVNDNIVNFKGGPQPSARVDLPLLNLKNPDGSEKGSFTPQLIVIPSSNEANPTAGQLGSYRVKVTDVSGNPKNILKYLGEGKSKEIEYFPSIEEAVKQAYEMYKPHK